MSLKEEVIHDNLKTPRRWLGLRMAQSAGLVSDALQMAAQNRKQLREAWEYQKASLGMGSTNAATTAQTEDEDVGNIVVGDQQTTVYNMAAAQKSGTLGKFAKAAALGAAILGAGGIGSIATMYACGIFNKPKEAQPEVLVEAPTFEADGYGLKIVPDDEVHE